jgi:hypothetical protein
VLHLGEVGQLPPGLPVRRRPVDRAEQALRLAKGRLRLKLLLKMNPGWFRLDYILLEWLIRLELRLGPELLLMLCWKELTL